MRKIAKVIMLTVAGIILSLLLIETSSVLRKLFTKEPAFWHEKLTDGKAFNFSKQENLLKPIIDDTNIIFASANEDGSKIEKRYQRIKTETPLYKTKADTENSPSNILFMLPKSYFVKIIKDVTLDSGEEGYYVRYNTYEGYAKKSAFFGTMSDITTTQSGIKISLTEDFGSYLRSSPEIKDENKQILIEKGTTGIVLIGKIYGETPSDGNTNEWYFVEYSPGPTTTYTGYVYAERCILDRPLTDLILESDKEVQKEEPETETLAGTNIDKPETETVLPETSLASNKLLWAVCIIFTLPVIFIFIMLIKKPKNARYIDDNCETDASFGLQNFNFDEEISPKIIKNNQKRYKFKSGDIETLSKFVKPNISLETSEEFDDQLQGNNQNHEQNNYYSITKTNVPKAFSLKNNTNPSQASVQNTSKTQSLENAIVETNKPYTLSNFENLKNFINDTSESENFNLAQSKTKKPWSISKMIKKLTSKNKLSKRISANRNRDVFRPGVISSDDYFEFADSFELTTPINSHYILNQSKGADLAKRQGKKINKRH